MEIEKHKLLRFCWKSGVTVYPVMENNLWYIQANNNGRKTTYRTNELSKNTTLKMNENLEERITNCYQHWYEKIKNNG